MTVTDTFYIGTDSDEFSDFLTLASRLANKGKPIEPQWTFTPFADHRELADGTRLGVGSPQATWHWDHRDDVHLEALRALCPGLSANLFIRTPTNDTSSGARVWETFSCIMLWPPIDEDKQAGHTLDFTIEFRRLEVVT